jgi:hypothetical protein
MILSYISNICDKLQNFLDNLGIFMDKVALRNIISSTKTLKVLFVEDEDTSREALTQFMSVFLMSSLKHMMGKMDGTNLIPILLI